MPGAGFEETLRLLRVVHMYRCHRQVPPGNCAALAAGRSAALFALFTALFTLLRWPALYTAGGPQANTQASPGLVVVCCLQLRSLCSPGNGTCGLVQERRSAEGTGQPAFEPAPVSVSCSRARTVLLQSRKQA